MKKDEKEDVYRLMVMVIIFALTSLLFAQETDPAKVLNALADALNVGDINTAMTLYAPDAVLNIVPPPPGLPGTYTGSKEWKCFKWRGIKQK